MKNRTVQYVVWIAGSLLLLGAAFALIFEEVFPARSGGAAIGLFWVWTGFLLMMGWHPEYRQWDRWEQQVYGLAVAWAGGALAVIGFTSLIERINVWLLISLIFAPPALIALTGRLWYVEKKRSQAWKKQNQTEKD